MKKILLSCFTLLLCVNMLQAQSIKNLLFNSYDNIVRLNFGTGSPVVSYTGLSNGYEGIAHAEDGSGNILFWVNANGVYDATFTLMPNSVGLLADPSSAEINICPIPGVPNKYYILYNNETCSQLYYAIVDMSLRSGKGDAQTINNQFDNSYFSEGLEVVEIPGGGYRLLAFECYTGFYSFDITSSGISNKTLLYSYPAPGGDGRGELEYNNGKLGHAFNQVNYAIWGDYNVSTNTFTNPHPVTYSGYTENGFYGLEFSPDNSKVYVSAWYENSDYNLFQYDAATGAELNKWKNITTSTQMYEDGPGQIELGPDGKLYMINNGAHEITVISYPNSTSPTFTSIVTTSELALGVSDHIQSKVIDVEGIHSPFARPAYQGLTVLPGERLSFKDIPANSELFIYNTLGQQLYYVKDYKNNFVKSTLPEALYYYRVVDPNGNEYTGKVNAW